MGTGVGGSEECKYLRNWVNLITTDKTKLGRMWFQLGGKAQLSGSGRAWQRPSRCIGYIPHLPAEAEAAAEVPACPRHEDTKGT